MFDLRFMIAVQTTVLVAMTQVWTSWTEGMVSPLGFLWQESYLCFFVLHVSWEVVYPLVLIVKVSLR